MSKKTDTDAAAETEVDAPETTEAEEFSIPEDLTTLEDPELETLIEAANARGAELAAKGDDLTDEELEEAEAVGQYAVEFAAEKDRRAAEFASKRARASAALARFATTEETETPAPEAPAAEVETPAAEVEAPAAELAVTGPARFRGASPAFLRSKTTVAAPARAESQFSMIATGFAREPEGTSYESVADVAKALHKKRMSFSNIPAGVQEYLPIASATKTFDEGTPMVGLDPQTNLVALRDVQEALVASGTCCTPQTPLYDFFRLAQPIRDVEDVFTTVQAPRGGIRYITPNCTIAGAGAIGFWDCDDNASTDPQVVKPCARVTCPAVEEVLVEAITQCVLFDNLQYRTFPELIENFMEDVAVQFALKKQRYYLDFVNGKSTVTQGIGVYGAARALMFDHTLAAIAYRKRHHMPRGARLQLMLPDWTLDLIKADLLNDGDSGLDYLNVPDSAVIAAYSSRDIDVSFFYDAPTSLASAVTLAQPQAAGPINTYPDVVTAYLFAPGTFVKLDGGTLDLGLVRDHQLNLKNDFAMFMEEWIGAAMLGCESVRIDSTVCPSGSRAGYAGSLLSCA